MRFIVLVLVAVFVLLVVVAGVMTPRTARAATIATDALATEPAKPVVTDPAVTIATDAPVATAPSIAVSSTSVEADPPREVFFGRFLYEPYMVSGGAMTGSTASERHLGGRFGIDMLAANGDGATKLGGGIRFTLGGDGAGAFGTEGQLLLGVVRTISDRAAVALVAPLGFTLGGGNNDFGPHGYAGIEGIAAVGRFAREQGPSVRGVELAAGISNRGTRARAGIVRPGKEVGWGLGVDWQRDGAYDLVGVYFATTAGR